MEEICIERKKLEETIEIIRKNINLEQEDLRSLYDSFVGSRDQLWKVATAKQIHITNLTASLDNPYFARIDFKDEDDGKVVTIYIGKNGISNGAEIVVTDWRAPISSLYYDYEIGKCSFEAPGGIIKGDMLLKRQYEIEQGYLLEYFDVNLVSNDGLLQKYLNSNNDARLKSIVSTIQKEQNAVIRKKMIENIIIQGVAGSGKTTVALHRIAYLVYNYMKTIHQNQYLVIGPNPVFIKYIKSVLPDLDVSGVEQCTFEQFAKNYIQEDINISDPIQKVNASINGVRNNDIDKFKCSTKYKDMLQQFLDSFIYNLTSSDLKLGDFVVLSSEEISHFFQDVKNSTVTKLDNLVDITITRLVNYIENNFNRINSRYNDYSFELFSFAKTEEEKQNLRKKFLKEREELKKGCRSILRKYFSSSKASVTKLYKLYISLIENYDIYNYKHLKKLKKDTLSNIKAGYFDFEDLAALMFIKSYIYSNKTYDRIRHVVIDEAQDLGEFNFFILKKILPSATYSIFGDLAQSIYDYRGIDNWNIVNSIMFNNEGQIVNFNKSYRTTSEIMGVADVVSDSIGLGKSDLVVRHGEDVSYTSVENHKDIPDYIIAKVEEYRKKGYKTIAIISKTDLLSSSLNRELVARGLNIPNINVDDDLLDDKFKICTISNQLAKGLEFDAVIINDVSEQTYCSSNSLDMKLLYVAITRALHELEIIYSGELTKPLYDNLKKKDFQQLKRVKK